MQSEKHASLAKTLTHLWQLALRHIRWLLPVCFAPRGLIVTRQRGHAIAAVASGHAVTSFLARVYHID
jgi:hypothetical protein